MQLSSRVFWCSFCFAGRLHESLILTDMTGSEKTRDVAVILVRVVLLFTLLYFFICSLNFLSDAFRLLGGEYRFTIAPFMICQLYLFY